MLHILRFFFSSRCRLFHNAIFFGSCNIHVLNTRCAKILKENSGAKGLMFRVFFVQVSPDLHLYRLPSVSLTDNNRYTT